MPQVMASGTWWAHVMIVHQPFPSRAWCACSVTHPSGGHKARKAGRDE